MQEEYYEKISNEFFKNEWSGYQGNWDFRELLRYLSDRRVKISINKGSLWIETDMDSIEILLYYPMNDEEQKEQCKELYETFCRWDIKRQETIKNIKSLLF